MKLAQKIAINYTLSRLHILALVSKRKAAKKALDIFFTPRLRSKKKPSAIFEKGEKLSFKLNWNTVRGYRWMPQKTEGEPAKKILILHGFESSIKKFDQYVAGFIKKGYEVLAFDAPAHGDSGGKRLNLPLYVEMIKNIYQQYGPVQSFLSHSFGGIAVVHFLESIPHDKNTKLVLIAPATETTTSVDLFFAYLQLDNEVRREFNNLIYEKTGYRTEYFSIKRAVRKIKASILWFHDEEDLVTPIGDVLKVKEDNNKNIQFVFTKGLGHRNIYRDSKVMKEVIDFL
jgi:pimeloyl-ACP methyl ester carboxylesterase